MTHVPELMAAAVDVAFGHDCVMAPLYGVCVDYALEVAHMGLHVVQMTSQKDIRACFDAVTANAAKWRGMGSSRGAMRALYCCGPEIRLKLSDREQIG